MVAIPSWKFLGSKMGPQATSPANMWKFLHRSFTEHLTSTDGSTKGEGIRKCTAGDDVQDTHCVLSNGEYSVMVCIGQEIGNLWTLYDETSIKHH